MMRYDAQVERLEVPFIWAHRRDYLLPQMTRRHLWYVHVYSPSMHIFSHPFTMPSHAFRFVHPPYAFL